jgi:hypothetical protein
MKQSITGQLTQFYAAAYLDLSVAAAQRWLSGNPQTLERAGWAAYDSFVALANEMTNQLYANPVVASSFGRALEAAFHVQHLFDALSPSIPAALPAPTELAATEPVDTAPGITLATRGAHYAEAAAQYRAGARARRPRRAAAA